MVFGKTVRDEMEKRIAEQGLPRREAALKLLGEQPGYYVQTPEGEYLVAAISTRSNWVNDYQWRTA
jgi:hypothetical protein